MSTVALYPTRGFIIELDRTPAGLVRRLERDGVALIASRTVEGIYAEPATSLAALLAALDQAGLNVVTLRPAGETRPWERTSGAWRTARPAIRNPRSACWLPTLPAA